MLFCVGGVLLVGMTKHNGQESLDNVVLYADAYIYSNAGSLTLIIKSRIELFSYKCITDAET